VSPDRVLLDTSAVIGLGGVPPERLSVGAAISTLTLAELTAGPSLTDDASEKARRQDMVQRIEAEIEALAFDPACARAFSHISSAAVAIGRKPRGGRVVDLMIAATALSYRLPLYTLSATDFRGLDDLIEIVDLNREP
jgi:predicted nucleic acid-binding protein